MKAEKLFLLVEANEIDKAIEQIGKAQPKKILEKKNIKGQTLLHVAAEKGHLSLLSKLIEISSPRNIVAYFCCLLHFKEELKYDLSPENIDDPDKRNWTPLLSACNEGHLKACVLLLQAGADPLRANNSETTFLHYFARINFDENPGIGVHLDAISSILAMRSVSPNVFNNRGETPLHQAALRGRTLTTTFLLEQNAIIDLTTKQGETALHFAARGGFPLMVKLLLDHGADPTIAGEFGTPADVAMASNQNECLELLSQHVVGSDGFKVRLRRIISHPELCVVFYEFLAKSFSHENLAFYLAVEDYKQLYDDGKVSERNEKGNDIYLRYVKAGAIHEINVDAMTREAVDVSNLSKTTFTSCQDYVFSLMADDLLRKFNQSPLYLNYCNGKLPQPSKSQTGDLWNDIAEHFKGRIKWLEKRDDLNEQKIDRVRKEDPNKRLSQSTRSQNLRSSGSQKLEEQLKASNSGRNSPVISRIGDLNTTSNTSFSGNLPIVPLSSSSASLNSSASSVVLSSSSSRKKKKDRDSRRKVGTSFSDDEDEKTRGEVRKSRNFGKRAKSPSHRSMSPSNSPRLTSPTTSIFEPTLEDLWSNWHALVECIAQNDEKLYFVDAKVPEPMNDEIMQILCNALSKNSYVQGLDLSKSGINDTHVVMLFSFLVKPTTKEVNLSFNQITNDGAAYLKYAIEQGSGLEGFSLLGNNRIHNRFITSISLLIGQKNKNSVLQDRLASSANWTTDVDYLSELLRQRNWKIKITGQVERCSFDCLFEDRLSKLHFVEENAIGVFERLEARLKKVESVPDHPNLSKYIRHKEIENRVYLVCDGGECTLATDIARRSKLRSALSLSLATSTQLLYTPQQLCNIMQSVVEGLLFLHSHQVYHCTLKPENIIGFYTPEGHIDRVKLEGMHQVCCPIAELAGLPLAPELHSPLGSFLKEGDAMADVYGIGVLFYELLCLEKAFKSCGADIWNFQKQNPITLDTETEKFLITNGYGDIIRIISRCVRPSSLSRPSLAEVKELLGTAMRKNS